MATKFEQPTEFDFCSPNKWKDWKNRFLRFRLASKLTKESDEVQVSSLIYAMGMEAKNILKSFNLSAFDSKVFDTVIGKFDDHFIPKRNIIHERAKFNQRKQNNGESAEQFIRSLREISHNCDFGTAKNDRIRDYRLKKVLEKHYTKSINAV